MVETIETFQSFDLSLEPFDLKVVQLLECEIIVGQNLLAQVSKDYFRR